MINEYYLATKDERGYLIYESPTYKLSENDLLSLLKLCLKDGRNKKLGTKILEVYKDSNENDTKNTEKKLRAIGLINGKTKPKTKKNIQSR